MRPVAFGIGVVRRSTATTGAEPRRTVDVLRLPLALRPVRRPSCVCSPGPPASRSTSRSPCWCSGSSRRRPLRSARSGSRRRSCRRRLRRAALAGRRPRAVAPQHRATSAHRGRRTGARRHRAAAGTPTRTTSGCDVCAAGRVRNCFRRSPWALTASVSTSRLSPGGRLRRRSRRWLGGSTVGASSSATSGSREDRLPELMTRVPVTSHHRAQMVSRSGIGARSDIRSWLQASSSDSAKRRSTSINARAPNTTSAPAVGSVSR